MAHAMTMVGKLRSRLEHSDRLARALAGGIGGYLRLCQRRIDWQYDGLDALKVQLAQGPVLVMMWHQRILMGPLHWPIVEGPLSALHASSPIGRVAGAYQRSEGLTSVAMGDGGNVGASRHVLRSARNGISISIACDGPKGPAQYVKDAPLSWARKTGLPIWAYTFATTRGRHLNTWDRMWMPKPFGKGAVVFKPLQGELAAEPDAARDQVATFLNATTDYANGLISNPSAG